MTLRKRIFTAAAAAVMTLSLFPLTAFADDEAAEPAAYEKKAVTAYLYSMEKSEQLECLFLNGMPEGAVHQCRGFPGQNIHCGFHDKGGG